jgi:O-antigen/teichoic acid export membrane protein
MNKKILKWNFVFQYGWVLTNIFNSILLLPLYLKNIDANTLGVWLATGSILGWITLVDPGVGEVLQQKIAELRGKNEDSEVGKAIGSGFIASLFILVFSLLVGFACFFSIELLIDKDVSQYPHLYNALIISVIATGMSLVSFSLSGINQGLLNSAHVAICALSANFLFLFINLLLLFLGYGVLSIAIANLCRALFIVVYNLIALFGVLKKLNLFITYNLIHFKRFIAFFHSLQLPKSSRGWLIVLTCLCSQDLSRLP